MCLACNREFQEEIQKCPHDGTALISLRQEDEWIGRTLGDRYDVTELLGKGGMGVVYLARQRVIDRWVAIKMLQAELTQDEVSVKRFEQEAKAASCLNHPHLVTLHDYGITTTGQPFLVMEYLQGNSLLDIIKRHGPLSPRRAIKIFSQVAEGLQHAHHQGIVHRDLKPSNIILVDQEGDAEFVKVVDFGLAKLMPWSGKESQHLTKTGEVFGSPIYMSPEQCMGRELRPTSDIYSLGITMFEALTGKPPFKGANSIQTASKHLSEAPPHFVDIRPDLDLPDALETVVFKALSKDPTARFQDMAEFKDALQSAAAATRAAAAANISQPNNIQALGATAAIPLHKQEQDRLRQSAASLKAVEEQKKPKPPLKLIAAIALLIIAGLAGAGVYMMMRGGGSTSQGTVYYFSRNEGLVEVFDAKTSSLQKIHLTQDAIDCFPKIGNETGRPLVGANIVLERDKNGDAIKGHMLGTTDGIVTAAYDTVVHQFLENICSPEPEKAKPYIAELDDWKNIDRDFPPGERKSRAYSVAQALDNEEQTPPAPGDAIKVESADPQGVKILVRQDAFLTKHNGFWRFNVTNGKLTYSDATQADWDNH